MERGAAEGDLGGALICQLPANREADENRSDIARFPQREEELTCVAQVEPKVELACFWRAWPSPEAPFIFSLIR